MKALAVILKFLFVMILAIALFIRWWGMDTVSLWALVTGFLFAFTHRLDWYLAKAGSDLYGSGMLLFVPVAFRFLFPYGVIPFMMDTFIFWLAMYFIAINLYHVVLIILGRYYKYPLVYLISAPLFRKAYLGPENAKGE